MWLRSSLPLLFTLTACDGVFGLTHVKGMGDAHVVDVPTPPDDVRPIPPFVALQTASAMSAASGGNGAALTVTFPNATANGNTLVFATAISTGNTRLTLLKDDAGNLWARPFDQPNSTASPAVRVELWIAINAKPMKAATVQYNAIADQRPMVATMIELPPIADPAVEDASVQASTTPGTSPVTGPIVGAAPSLSVAVLGTAAMVPATNMVTTSMYAHQPLPQVTTAATTVITGDLAWTTLPAGPEEVRWTLSGANNWAAGVAAYGLP